jgi:hypothetical protein
MFGRSGKNSPRYGTSHTEEAKEKISAIHKGRTLSTKHKEKLSKKLKGKKQKEETKRKISNALTGRTRSEAHRENLSKAHKGSESSKKSGNLTMAYKYEDPDHPELGQKAAPVLARMQKSRGYPHDPENRVRVE